MHLQIMGTYAFLPREAVTAFLMGCPQCSTNNAASTAVSGAVEDLSHRPPLTVATAGFYHHAGAEQWSPSFACSTPVKSDVADIHCADTEGATGLGIVAPIVTVAGMGPDKENVTDNDGQTTATPVTNRGGNKRKRTVPLKRGVRQPYQVIVTSAAATASSNSSAGSNNTLKNNSDSSCTLVLSSSSSSLSCRTDFSSVSRSSGGWWSKWGMNSNSSRLSGGVGGACGSGDGSSDLSGVTNNAQPLDLSSSPVSTFSPISPETTTVRSSSSPTEDFFYKRRHMRLRRIRPKRLKRQCFSRRRDHHKNDDASASDGNISEEVPQVRGRGCDVGNAISSDEDKKANFGGIKEERELVSDDWFTSVEVEEKDDGPKPAKIMKRFDEKVGDNNNDDDYYDKATAVTTTTMAVNTTTEIHCCTDATGQVTVKPIDVVSKVTREPFVMTTEVQEELTESDESASDTSDKSHVSQN